MPRRVHAQLAVGSALVGLISVLGACSPSPPSPAVATAAQPATAAPPESASSSGSLSPLAALDAEITDRAGALDVSEAQAAVDELADQTPYQLFVVYVESFGGVDGREWANQTATNAGLGQHDLLLAVATQDREYGLSADTNSTISDAELDGVESAARDRLRESDWTGAVVAAAASLLPVGEGPLYDLADACGDTPGWQRSTIVDPAGSIFMPLPDAGAADEWRDMGSTMTCIARATGADVRVPGALLDDWMTNSSSMEPLTTSWPGWTLTVGMIDVVDTPTAGVKFEATP